MNKIKLLVYLGIGGVVFYLFKQSQAKKVAQAAAARAAAAAAAAAAAQATAPYTQPTDSMMAGTMSGALLGLNDDAPRQAAQRASAFRVAGQANAWHQAHRGSNPMLHPVRPL